MGLDVLTYVLYAWLCWLLLPCVCVLLPCVCVLLPCPRHHARHHVHMSAVLPCKEIQSNMCLVRHLQVQKYLSLFITEMEQLFERHKTIAGQKDVKLHIL